MSYQDNILAKLDELSGRNVPDEILENETLREQARKLSRDFDKATNAIETLSTFLGGNDRNEMFRHAVLNGIRSMHRHHQHQFLNALLLGLGDLGIVAEESPGMWVDGRNEREMKILSKMRRALNDDLYWQDAPK